MTERSARHLHRDQSNYSLGPTQLQWDRDHLRIDIEECCAPFPRRISGTVRVFPHALCSFVTPLDDEARHRWGPIAPCARVEVELKQPELAWKGEAYLDSNDGDEPVTRVFQAWDWSRARHSDDSVSVLYDVRQTNASERIIARRFYRDGSSSAFEPPERPQQLPRTFWRVNRSIRSDSAHSASITKTLEDGPFYARSLVKAKICGEDVMAVHETLEAQRLNSLAVRLMLPWRMPRRP